MKEISDKIQAIATTLGAGYIRAKSIKDSNITSHYTNITGTYIFYIGFGNIKNSFSGAVPVKQVDVEVYVVAKTGTTDDNASQRDVIMALVELDAYSIVNKFIALQPILEYTMDAVSINDDMLIGYLLKFSPELEGYGC